MTILRLMTQNQWNITSNAPYWEEQGLDCSAKNRMKGHFRVFRELAPDVVGGQEVNKDMQLELMMNCQEAGAPYTLIWGNMTPIIYRADKLELLAHQYLLYPLHYEGYEGIFNDAQSKSANLAVFRCKGNGAVFIFLTTHLWWKNGSNPNSGWYQMGSDGVRKEQIGMAMDLIARYQKQYGNCPAFLVGDLNACYRSEAVQYAITEGGFSHAHDIAADFANEGKGYHPCSPKQIGEWQDAPFETAIDHILVKDAPAGSILRFDRYTPDYYRYLSDHAPAFVDVVLNDSKNT